MNKLTPALELKVIAEYETGLTSREVGAMFGIDKKTVTNILRRHGKEPRKGGAGRTYSLNEAAFDIITDVSAYWFGLLLADGGLAKRKGSYYVLKLSLADKDRCHVESFRDFLGSNQPVYTEVKDDHTLATLQVSSKRLCDTLRSMGMHPRKSFSADVLPIFVNNHHFWRGLIDGDGWVIKTRPWPVIGLIGSKLCCRHFQDFAQSIYPNKGSIFTAGSMYRFTVQGMAAIHVIDRLYRKAPISLPRKQKNADYWLARGYRAKSGHFPGLISSS